MTILGWIFFGLIVGLVGRLLLPGKDPAGFFVTIVIGIVGAVIGGGIGRLLGFYQSGEPAGFVMAVIGAMLFLLLYRRLRR